MAQVCVDPQGLVLVHSDGTLAHEDCPCGGGGPCCVHGNYCNLPTPLMVECTATGSVGINGVISEPYDVRQTFPISISGCNGTGSGGSTPIAPRFLGRFEIEVSLSPVGGNYSVRPTPLIPYSVVAGLPFVRRPVVSVLWRAIFTTGPRDIFQLRFDYDFAQGGGWTGVNAGQHLPMFTTEGSASAPSASEFQGRCPTRVSASGQCRDTEPGPFYQEGSAAVSIKLLNATGCGNDSPPGLTPPPGVELPPGWRWTENGPVPNLGCGGCGG